MYKRILYDPSCKKDGETRLPFVRKEKEVMLLYPQEHLIEVIAYRLKKEQEQERLFVEVRANVSFQLNTTLV